MKKLHPRVLDLRDRKFGRLYVLDRDWSKRTIVFWLCKCICYNFASIQSSQLTAGTTKSCGCIRREMQTRHGMFKMPEYGIWQGIIDRCCRPERDPEAWARYGGRGIGICNEWKNNPRKFYEDLGPRPNKQMTVERIDNNKGYSKENCRWATRKEQGRNRRDNHIVKYQGVEMSLAAFRENFCSHFTHESIRYRLKQGLSTEQIINTPKHVRYSKLVAGMKFG